MFLSVLLEIMFIKMKRVG